MSTVTPGAGAPPVVRRSAVRRRLADAGLALRPAGDVEISVGGARAQGAALADLSTCDRIGLKGRASTDWLASRGLPIPPRPNRSAVHGDGTIVARYAEAEFVVASFAAPASARVAALRAELTPAAPAGVYPVPRADGQAAFGIEGPDCVEALAGLCPADLRPRVFGPGDMLQTLCAGVGGQVLNLSADGAPRIVLLCDSSYALHVWDALAHAVAGLGGATVGQDTWFAAGAA